LLLDDDLSTLRIGEGDPDDLAGVQVDQDIAVGQVGCAAAIVHVACDGDARQPPAVGKPSFCDGIAAGQDVVGVRLTVREQEVVIVIVAGTAGHVEIELVRAAVRDRLFFDDDHASGNFNVGNLLEGVHDRHGTRHWLIDPR